MTAKYINVLVDSRTVAIGTPGGNLSLKIKSRAHQIKLFGFKVICWALLFIFKLRFSHV